MSGHPPISGLDDFCHVLAASGLVKPRSLTDLLRQFQTTGLAEGASTDPAQAFAAYLVEGGVLTPWQAEKLKNGQYKGFFMEQYKLVERLEPEQTWSRYAAEDTTSGQRVVLCVQPLAVSPPKDGKLDYWVEKRATS